VKAIRFVLLLTIREAMLLILIGASNSHFGNLELEAATD
jgi:hypothetical protein